MKKCTAIIGALVSLLPLGQPLVIGTGAALTSAAVILSVPEKVQAESADFYIDRGIEKGKSGDYYGAISDFNQAIKIADRGYVIVHGKIEFEGESAAELQDNEMIKQYYLGV